MAEGTNTPVVGGVGALYSLAGILAYLQAEWTRFERQAAKWELERAELKMHIARLEGERQSQNRLKDDLVRRIKMLEFALQKERQKNGTQAHPPTDRPVFAGGAGSSRLAERKEAGTSLLRQYLAEMGFTDTLLQAHAAQVRLAADLDDISKYSRPLPLPTAPPPMQHAPPMPPSQPAPVGRGQLTEEEVMGEFAFLDSADAPSQQPAQDDEGFALSPAAVPPKRGTEGSRGGRGPDEAPAPTLAQVMDTFRRGPLTDEERHALAQPQSDQQQQLETTQQPQPDPISATTSTPPPARKEEKMQSEWEAKFDSAQLTKMMKSFDRGMPKKGKKKAKGTEDLQAMLAAGGAEGSQLGGLGSLAMDDTPPDVQAAKQVEASRKMWKPKTTLRSHFDSVRCVSFHPSEAVALSASEDGTAKLWHLHNIPPASAKQTIDSTGVEPLFTFRGHHGGVFSCAVDRGGSLAYTGGQDAVVRVWALPPLQADIYAPYDRKTVQGVLAGHSNAVWSLATHPAQTLLASASADGTCILWAPTKDAPLQATYRLHEQNGIPTSVCFVDGQQLAVGHVSSHMALYDVSTGQTVCQMDSRATADGTIETQINAVAAHPTMPLLASAHEDRHIRFYDPRTGKCVHSMTAHLDAVTALAFDPTGLYLLSAGHDSSLRMWETSSKGCVQEISGHRRKADEGVLTVAFHSTLPYMASGGADATLKIYT